MPGRIEYWDEKPNPVMGHSCGRNTRAFCTYTVYDNREDMPVIVDGEARECARVMGIAFGSFYSAVSNARSGKVKKWTIIEHYYDGKKRYTGFG